MQRLVRERKGLIGSYPRLTLTSQQRALRTVLGYEAVVSLAHCGPEGLYEGRYIKQMNDFSHGRCFQPPVVPGHCEVARGEVVGPLFTLYQIKVCEEVGLQKGQVEDPALFLGRGRLIRFLGRRRSLHHLDGFFLDNTLLPPLLEITLIQEHSGGDKESYQQDV